MMNRMKVFAADSVEAMAKITRELGGDARIYSTRRVNGGIEIIAGTGEDDEDERLEAVQRSLPQHPKTKAQARSRVMASALTERPKRRQRPRRRQRRNLTRRGSSRSKTPSPKSNRCSAAD